MESILGIEGNQRILKSGGTGGFIDRILDIGGISGIRDRIRRYQQ